MKAIVVTTASHGQPILVDCDAPSALGRNLLVKVHASSLNPHDWKYLQWFAGSVYRLPLPLPPLRLGHDFVGTVMDTGSRVRDFAPGDLVFGMTAKPGAFAERLTIDERMVASKPTNLSDHEAAALPMVALTALQALRMAGLRRGMSVLVIGGSGGVGSMAVQIAKHQGAQVSAVCGTRNVDFVRRLGAKTIIDYQQSDFHDCGQRFDVIFDTIGNESATTCRDLLKPSACFISTATSAFNALSTVQSRAMARFKPAAVRSGTLLALPRGGDLEVIRTMVEAGQLRVHIDKQFPLEQMQDAISYSQRGRTRGKIAIDVGNPS